MGRETSAVCCCIPTLMNVKVLSQLIFGITWEHAPCQVSFSISIPILLEFSFISNLSSGNTICPHPFPSPMGVPAPCPPPSRRNVAVVSRTQYVLTVVAAPSHTLRPRWPLTLKVVSESRVTWATSVSILVFLGLSVLELGLLYVTDRCQTKALLNAPAY